MNTSEFLPTRQTLLSRLRAWDDGQSWNEFFALYGKLLFSVAKKAGLTQAEAEDVVQETIISVARELPGFKYDQQRGSFKGWLKRIAQRRIADHFRSRARQPMQETLEDNPEEEASTGPSVQPLEELWDAEWRTHITQIAMEALHRKVSPRHFQVFELHVMQGMGVRDVARLMSIPTAQVYLLKHRLGRMFKHELQKLEQ